MVGVLARRADGRVLPRTSGRRLSPAGGARDIRCSTASGCIRRRRGRGTGVVDSDGVAHPSARGSRARQSRAGAAAVDAGGVHLPDSGEPRVPDARVPARCRAWTLRGVDGPALLRVRTGRAWTFWRAAHQGCLRDEHPDRYRDLDPRESDRAEGSPEARGRRGRRRRAGDGRRGGGLRLRVSRGHRRAVLVALLAAADRPARRRRPNRRGALLRPQHPLLYEPARLASGAMECGAHRARLAHARWLSHPMDCAPPRVARAAAIRAPIRGGSDVAGLARRAVCGKIRLPCRARDRLPWRGCRGVSLAGDRTADRPARREDAGAARPGLDCVDGPATGHRLFAAEDLLSVCTSNFELRTYCTHPRPRVTSTTSGGDWPIRMSDALATK